MSADVRATAGQLEEATETLRKTSITAPFAGKLGLKLVSLGAYLDPGSPIVRLTQIHPLHFVFASTKTGRPVHATTIRAHFKALLPEADLPRTTRVHDLRHGACSVLANTTGVPLTVARDRLGHSSVRMTERYVHADPDSQRRAAEALAEALGGSRKRV